MTGADSVCLQCERRIPDRPYRVNNDGPFCCRTCAIEWSHDHPPAQDPNGTPCVSLRFTRRELEAIAWPDSIEQWIHGLVNAALSGSMEYEHRHADEPDGDANSVKFPAGSAGATNPTGSVGSDLDEERRFIAWLTRDPASRFRLMALVGKIHKLRHDLFTQGELTVGWAAAAEAAEEDADRLAGLLAHYKFVICDDGPDDNREVFRALRDHEQLVEQRPRER